MLLPERLLKEPLGSAIRYGGDRLLEIVNWVSYALIQAEKFGMTNDNIDSFGNGDDPAVKRFLGTGPSLGQALQIDPNVFYKIIKTLGNYGEIFDRDVGPATKIGFQRGYNKPWTQGGLLYSPPFP